MNGLNESGVVWLLNEASSGVSDILDELLINSSHMIGASISEGFHRFYVS